MVQLGTAVTVLVPAHDEAQALPAAIASLRAQTLPPDRLLVIADNCTDATATVAARLGAEVVTTVGNTARKAGALNQVLDVVLPTLPAGDLVLVMDADSAIAPDFLAAAVRTLRERPAAGAVGGVFEGRPGGGLVGALQRNEYARYGREVARRNGRAVVLTGTATLFRAEVLREVAAARGARLPGRPGTVYDLAALTEDNEITLAIKTLGYGAASPRECRVITELMPTWRALWHQRLRWQRGALENLRAYGLTPVTLPYIGKQVAMYLGIAAVALFVLATLLFATHGELGVPRGFWLAITAVFVLERVITVRRSGWRAMALAAPVVVEFAYDLFQQAVFLRAASDALAGRSEHWHHHPAALLTGPG
ncbi:glycosyltransferase family 2 protein [Pseudonocardia sp. GCM10023141]|uniref:glycosyltransferase family 2 protein n=1 Tax=Pseudonocardia sp. GCM10023141 TaxID=3252653 RepID=UPI00361677FB